MNETYLIVGGGTGGHIAPGIALYAEFGRLGKQALVLTTWRDRRFPLLGEVKSQDLCFYRGPALTRNPFRLPVFLFGFLSSIIRSMRLMKKNTVTAVIGMGGYASAPALLGALLTGRKIFLCEQNSVPGKVVKLFEKKCAAIFTTFEETVTFLENRGAVHCVGNPVREKSVRAVSRAEAKKYFHLGHCRHVLLVIGGSQGSLGINRMVLDVKRNFPALFKDIGIIWITGALTYDRFREEAKNEIETGSIFLARFIEDVALSYRAADLAVSRSGAGVMAELAAVGLPSILVPFPHATQDHQTLNAASFEKGGAAVLLKEDEALAGNMAQALQGMLGNATLLKRMSRNALAMARPRAGAEIASAVITMMQEK